MGYTKKHVLKVVWTNKKLKDKDWMISQIYQLEAEASTNLFAGVDQGYRVLMSWALEEERATDRRIFLFSDGMVNVGVTDHNEITKQVGLMFEESRIITSAFGVGASFDRELMTRIASSGKGDFFFISDPCLSFYLFVYWLVCVYTLCAIFVICNYKKNEEAKKKKKKEWLTF
ncbi:von Willebrand factor type A [Reticulomyxa filosa]|uniref:von Willebrand factor type A n=1 Tax=Reticulomyxa filosa TaxID=46433 RepID=X6MEV4_RETFI|nr:von Willebrand factor type A [Reticulomyxa filosa]|eukprot:ETO12394.1 von Willebrand factor type A [Reticulomyxa filosa]